MASRFLVLRRLGRLGFFLGLGAATAVVAACRRSGDASSDVDGGDIAPEPAADSGAAEDGAADATLDAESGADAASDVQVGSDASRDAGSESGPDASPDPTTLDARPAPSARSRRRPAMGKPPSRSRGGKWDLDLE